MRAIFLILMTMAAQAQEPVPVEGPYGIRLLPIPAGKFVMGGSDLLPIHRREIQQPFYLAETELTQSQWTTAAKAINTTVGKQVLPEKPWLDLDEGEDPVKEGDLQPASHISWFEAKNLVSGLNDCPVFIEQQNAYTVASQLLAIEVCLQVKRDTGEPVFDLPTEAQWVFASHGKVDWAAVLAGKVERPLFPWGDKFDGKNLWWDGNAKGHPGQVLTVGHQNSFGLYDMVGNVGEWVQDNYDREGKKKLPPPDESAVELDSGQPRVVRGGDFLMEQDREDLTCLSRSGPWPRSRSEAVGLRLARHGPMVMPVAEPKKVPPPKYDVKY